MPDCKMLHQICFLILIAFGTRGHALIIENATSFQSYPLFQTAQKDSGVGHLSSKLGFSVYRIKGFDEFHFVTVKLGVNIYRIRRFSTI